MSWFYIIEAFEMCHCQYTSLSKLSVSWALGVSGSQVSCLKFIVCHCQSVSWAHGLSRVSLSMFLFCWLMMCHCQSVCIIGSWCVKGVTVIGYLSFVHGVSLSMCLYHGLTVCQGCNCQCICGVGSWCVTVSVSVSWAHAPWCHCQCVCSMVSWRVRLIIVKVYYGLMVCLRCHQCVKQITVNVYHGFIMCQGCHSQCASRCQVGCGMWHDSDYHSGFC